MKKLISISFVFIIMLTFTACADKTEPITLDTKTMVSAKCFLEEFRKIELNEQIPVAIMIHDSGTSMKTYSPRTFLTRQGLRGWISCRLLL